MGLRAGWRGLVLGQHASVPSRRTAVRAEDQRHHREHVPQGTSPLFATGLTPVSVGAKHQCWRSHIDSLLHLEVRVSPSTMTGRSAQTVLAILAL